MNGTQLAAAGDEMLVNTYTAGDQNEPAVATTSDGLISVVWTSASGALDSDSTGISLQTLDPAGPDRHQDRAARNALLRGRR